MTAPDTPQRARCTVVEIEERVWVHYRRPVYGAPTPEDVTSGPWLSAAASCAACGYQWAAVVQWQCDTKECPQCGATVAPYRWPWAEASAPLVRAG